MLKKKAVIWAVTAAVFAGIALAAWMFITRPDPERKEELEDLSESLRERLEEVEANERE